MECLRNVPPPCRGGFRFGGHELRTPTGLVGCLLFTRLAGCRLPSPKILKGRWERRHDRLEPGRELVMRPADAVYGLLFELVAFPFERLADQECRRRSDCGAAAGFGQAGALGAQLSQDR